MRAFPTGTVTLVFTDIQGSSDLWERHQAAFKPVLDEHNRLMRAAAHRWSGYEVKTEGDAFFLSFARAADAVRFAVEAQRALAARDWGAILAGLEPLRVRMGLHAGEPLVDTHPDGERDYFGPVVNRAARVGAAGHGGQIVVSEPVRAAAAAAELEGTAFRDLGRHRLKGVGEEQLWQVLHPDLPADFPPLKTQDPARFNLPLQLTGFVGRERELQEVRELLGSHRLVTLTGPGGIGKTRLALRAAEGIRDRFPDGVLLVELAPVSDPELVLPAVARELGVADAGDRPLAEALEAHLSGRRVLLILDNFEQVTEAGPAAARLLRACPELRLLATSRVPLQVRGEREFALDPLPLPRSGRLPPLEELARCAAVELFVQRARDVKRDFALTPRNARDVTAICARLEGLPLAIELAAARLRTLPPAAMRARLESAFGARLELLTGGARDLPLRHQTLRATIAWSYDLLEPHEQALFRRLSVFESGFTLEAAAAVLGEERPGAMLDGAAALLTRSLLRCVDEEDEPRFAMLETVREYARERLEEDSEAEPLLRAHARHFLELAERAGPELDGPGQAEWLRRLDGERDNLRAALRWSAARAAELDTALGLAGALWRFWMTRGHLTEGREILGQLLERTEGREDAARARMLHAAGILAWSHGDYLAARSLHERCLALHRALGDRRGEAGALHNLGMVLQEQGAHAAARQHYEEALDLNRRMGNRAWEANNLEALGDLLEERGETAAAEPLFASALAIRREKRDRWGVANLQVHLARLAANRGEPAAARRFYAACLPVFAELGDGRGIAYCLEGLAAAAEDAGEAALLLGAAAARRESAGAPLTPAEEAQLNRLSSVLRQMLGEAAYREAAEAGAALEPDQAVSAALAGITPA